MKRSTEVLINNVKQLGYRTRLGSSNPNKPNQQLWIYKQGDPRPIAEVSLILKCRINTMFNGVGKNQKELLKVLYQYSVRGL